MTRRIRAATGTLMLLLLAGCATTDLGTPGDPLERMNRATHRFNNSIDRAVLKPVARGYRDHVPQLIRTGIDNFLGNLAFPTTIINDLLQLKVKDTLIDLGRFAVNTTLGIGGLLDPASHFGIPKNDEDFGQTLGRWGVPSGPYVVLPFFGPSSARDAPAFVVDIRTDLRIDQRLDPAVEWTLVGLSLVNRRSELLAFDASWENAYDPYAFIRNAWLQRREYQVRDGDVAEQDPLEGLEDPEEFEEPDAAAPAPPPETGNPAPGAQPPPDGSSNSVTSLMPASDSTDGGMLR